jgi:hypothetical protein
MTLYANLWTHTEKCVINGGDLVQITDRKYLTESLDDPASHYCDDNQQSITCQHLVTYVTAGWGGINQTHVTCVKTQKRALG